MISVVKTAGEVFIVACLFILMVAIPMFVAESGIWERYDHKSDFVDMAWKTFMLCVLASDLSILIITVGLMNLWWS